MLCLFVLKGHRDFVAFHVSDRRFIPRIEPRIGFRDLFDAQGDHAAQVALGVDVGEVVRHGVKVGQRLFFVQNFFRFFQISTATPRLFVKYRPLLLRFGSGAKS